MKHKLRKLVGYYAVWWAGYHFGYRDAVDDGHQARLITVNKHVKGVKT